MCPSRVPEGSERGWIVPIGGAENKGGNGGDEDKPGDPKILQRFAELCGGARARIVVLPTASRLADSGERYVKVFKELGAGEVTVLDFDTRRDCREEGRLKRIESATGIFFTGGNQMRLSTLIGGTPVARAIRACNARGVPVGGTSAGASILSDHMIASGQGGTAPCPDSVNLAPGLGLTNRFVIDQHFSRRDRLGRLAAALAYNPYVIGLGLDEDTAAFIGPDNTLEVEGSGTVTIVDAANLTFSSMDQVALDEPVCMLGLTIHILTPGATFNLETRRASAGSLAVAKS